MSSPRIYFFTEMAGAFGQLIFYKNPYFPIHGKPILASSRGQFWGGDWNLWVQNWPGVVSQGMRRPHKTRRIVVVFLLYELFHGLCVTFPTG
jgi:hypothetical protein